MTKNSIIAPSSKTFSISTNANANLGDEIVKVIKVAEVNNLTKYEKVVCTVKVLQVSVVEDLPNGKRKQDIVVADDSGSSKLVLWEGEVNRVEQDKSYQLNGVVIGELEG